MPQVASKPPAYRRAGLDIDPVSGQATRAKRANHHHNHRRFRYLYYLGGTTINA